MCNSCIRDLEKIKSGKSNDEKSTFVNELENDLKLNEDNKLVFKCNHYISKGNRNIETIGRDFIDRIILKLNEGFPKEDSNIVYAFGVLGMRPVSMYSGEALENWGKEQIEILNTGQEKQHKHGDVAQPVINIEAVRKEWGLVKPLVVKCGYPRFKLSELWGLINCYHKP